MDHRVDLRKAGRVQLHPKRRPVDLELQRIQHPASIGPLFLGGQRPVMIAIDVCEDCLSQGDAGRQVQFDLYASRVDGKPRRLEVLIGPMRRYLGAADDDHRQGQHPGATATSA